MSGNRRKLAFVIATKDRPDDLRKMLTSLDTQSHRPDQVVIVDSSAEPVEAVAAEFDTLNVTYMRHHPPSAAAQRNAGIKAVDADVDLIGFLDDDVVLEPDAIAVMLAFWAEHPEEIGGCGFNYRNYELPGGQRIKRSRLVQWLGLYGRVPGVVAASGWATVVPTVAENTVVEWLPSTAAVWRKEVLETFSFEEYFDGYSYLEDLDFSYSVSRKYKLTVVANAGFRHYPSPSGRIGLYQFGKIEVRNRLYIVRKHGLSVPKCYLAILIRMLMSIAVGVRNLDASMLRRAMGNIVGAFRSFLPGPRITEKA